METSDTNMGKIVVITGGSSGLGFAMAQWFSRKGFVPIIIARDPQKIQRALSRLREILPEVHGYSCDIRFLIELAPTAKSIQDRFGGIDFLILNAGEVYPGCVLDKELNSDLALEVEINLIGTIRSTRVFLPLLSPGTKILFISSGFGIIAAAGYAIYCAAKAGIIIFAEALRRELKSLGIAVYVACPGDIETQGLDQEKARMPDWMANSKVRPRAVSSEVEADRILMKCHGDRFLILTNFRIKLFWLGQKFLPESWLRFLLDRLLPKRAPMRALTYGKDVIRPNGSK